MSPSKANRNSRIVHTSNHTVITPENWTIRHDNGRSRSIVHPRFRRYESKQVWKYKERRPLLRISAKSTRQYGRSRPPNSVESVHPIRSKPSTAYGAKRPVIGAKRRQTCRRYEVVDLVQRWFLLPQLERLIEPSFRTHSCG